MKISYLHTTPVPQMSGTDALYNEILLLHNHFGGSTTCLYPFRKPNSSYPIPLFGLHNLREIKRKSIRIIKPERDIARELSTFGNILRLFIQ